MIVNIAAKPDEPLTMPPFHYMNRAVGFPFVASRAAQ